MAFPCSPCLILSALLFVVALLGSRLSLTALCPLCFSLLPSLFPVLLCLTVLSLIALCQTLPVARVPVLGIPSVSALLGLVPTA